MFEGSISSSSMAWVPQPLLLITDVLFGVESDCGRHVYIWLVQGGAGYWLPTEGADIKTGTSPL